MFRMMEFVQLITLLLVVITYFAGCQGERLQCHRCSSADHTACEDPFSADRAEAAGFLVTCPEPTEKGQRALCRKTHQTVMGKVRVIRSCGFVNHTESCLRTRNAEVVVRSCQCFEKACNGAGSTSLMPAALLLAAALRAIY